MLSDISTETKKEAMSAKDAEQREERMFAKTHNRCRETYLPSKPLTSKEKHRLHPALNLPLVQERCKERS